MTITLSSSTDPYVVSTHYLEVEREDGATFEVVVEEARPEGSIYQSQVEFRIVEDVDWSVWSALGLKINDMEGLLKLAIAAIKEQ